MTEPELDPGAPRRHDSLEDYLQSEEYRHDKEVQGRIERTLRVGIEGLISIPGHNHWPYLVRDRTEATGPTGDSTAPTTSSDSTAPTTGDSTTPATGDAKPKYSCSTNAMIIFALQAMSAELPAMAKCLGLSSPLLRRPERDVLPTLTDDTRENLRTRLEKSKERLIEEVAENWKSGVLATSGTFGPDDPLTLAWILEVAPEAIHADDRNKRLADVVKRALERGGVGYQTLPRRPNTAAPHALTLLRWVQCVELLGLNDTSDAGKEVTAAWPSKRGRIQGWFIDRVHHHLANVSRLGSDFDPAELVLALEGALSCDPRGERALSHLVNRVFSALRETVKIRGSLQPRRPIISTETGMTLIPLTVDVGLALLRIVERVTQDHAEGPLLNVGLSLVKDYVEETLDSIVTLELPTGRCDGWHSEHTQTEGVIHTWETSQVLLLLSHYSSLLQRNIARTVLDVGGFSVKRFKEPTDEEAKKKLAEKRTREHWIALEPFHLAAPWDKVEYRPSESFFDRFLEPRISSDSKTSPAISALLYGPPGTGKSTMVENLAEALGWQFVSVTPSDFVQRGGQLVEARAKAIFGALGELSDTVVLLDEIDQLILDRDCTEYQKQQDVFKFMTPGMLPKLKRLRDRGKDGRSIFVIATNYNERIDPAAKRAGRIDLKFLVLPPLRKRREVITKKAIQDHDPDWSSAPNAMTAEQVADSTPLFSWVELEGICRVDNFEVGEPQIRIEGYTGRLEDPEYPQRPNDEYLALARIEREFGKWTRAELKLVKPEALSAHLRDLYNDLLKPPSKASSPKNAVSKTASGADSDPTKKKSRKARGRSSRG